MADIADIANDHAQVMLDAALASRRLEGGASVEECVSCGGEIPPARRLALAGHGCLRCIECQGLHERRMTNRSQEPVPCPICGQFCGDQADRTCTEALDLADTRRLNFLLNAPRKVIVERLPSWGDHDTLEVYVEEGVLGEVRYPAVAFVGDWGGNPAGALMTKRRAIDAAIASFEEGRVDG